MSMLVGRRAISNDRYTFIVFLGKPAYGKTDAGAMKFIDVAPASF
jgi:hypothetical protein